MVQHWFYHPKALGLSPVYTTGTGSSSSIVVENWLHNPKVQGLSPTTGAGSNSSTLVQHWFYHPKAQGLSPVYTTDTGSNSNTVVQSWFHHPKIQGLSPVYTTVTGSRVTQWYNTGFITWVLVQPQSLDKRDCQVARRRNCTKCIIKNSTFKCFKSQRGTKPLIFVTGIEKKL